MKVCLPPTIVEAFRRAVVQAAAPEPWSLGWAALVSLVVLVAGYALFRAQEPAFADAL